MYSPRRQMHAQLWSAWHLQPPWYWLNLMITMTSSFPCMLPTIQRNLLALLLYCTTWHITLLQHTLSVWKTWTATNIYNNFTNWNIPFLHAKTIFPQLLSRAWCKTILSSAYITLVLPYLKFIHMILPMNQILNCIGRQNSLIASWAVVNSEIINTWWQWPKTADFWHWWIPSFNWSIHNYP
jgi:hypothetical protein